MKKKVVPTLQQEVKVKVDIVTSDDIKIYYTGKFQDFTARYIKKTNYTQGEFSQSWEPNLGYVDWVNSVKVGNQTLGMWINP